MQFLSLLRQAPRPLAFGALHSFGSSFGQTFLVALFVPFIGASLAINETEFANIYAGITIASALCLPFIGRLIDRIDMLRYSLATMVLLTIGCLVIAAAQSVWMLIVALFILRLAGQGLMSHVSMTGIARYFDRSRGRALAIASFGFPLAEAIMPVTLLALIAGFGWRATYAGAGVFIVVILMPIAILLIRDNAKFREAPGKTEKDGKAASTDHSTDQDASPASSHPRLFRSRYIWFYMPMLAAPPLVMTALFFHQGSISASKDIDLAWFAADFTVFAITSVIGAFGSGPLIDSHTARKLFPYYLIPAIGAVSLLAITETPVMIPVYMGMLGVTTGFATTLRTAIILELVPLSEIGAVRSRLTAVMVLASAIGPAIYGWMFAANIDIATTLWITIVAMAVVSMLSWMSERPGFYIPPGVARQTGE